MAVRPRLDKNGEPIPGEFIIDIRLQGRNGPRERIPFVGTETEARSYEMQLRGQGRRVGACVSPTFLDAIPEFLRDYGNIVSKSTLTDFHWAWKQLERTFSKIPMANITPSLVETYKAKRLEEGVKKRTINRELSYLAAILRWAEEHRHIPPMAYRIKRFPKKQTKSPSPTVHTPPTRSSASSTRSPQKSAGLCCCSTTLACDGPSPSPSAASRSTSLGGSSTW